MILSTLIDMKLLIIKELKFTNLILAKQLIILYLRRRELLFFIRRKSILNKILDSYTLLFEQWEKECFNDGCIEEITYSKII